MSANKQNLALDALSRLLVIVGMVYIGLGLLLYFAQGSFIYYPTPAVSIKGLSEQVIRNNGESIKIHVLNEGMPRALLYFGGNAEAVAYNAPKFKQAFSDHTIYLMNYRGYGGSTGSPSEESLYSDSLVLFDMVMEKHDSAAVIGRSLGSGIATYLAAKRHVSKLVLVTPFDSIVNVAASHYPVYPVSIMLKEKYDSLSRVPAIKAPTLMLIAANDRIVGALHGHKLASAFPDGQVVKHVLESSGHNSISSNPQYYEFIRDFL
jgi:pimeloyl-ACP methyl ester carboxylesterase